MYCRALCKILVIFLCWLFILCVYLRRLQSLYLCCRNKVSHVQTAHLLAAVTLFMSTRTRAVEVNCCCSRVWQTVMSCVYILDLISVKLSVWLVFPVLSACVQGTPEFVAVSQCVHYFEWKTYVACKKDKFKPHKEVGGGGGGGGVSYQTCRLTHWAEGLRMSEWNPDALSRGMWETKSQKKVLKCQSLPLLCEHVHSLFYSLFMTGSGKVTCRHGDWNNVRWAWRNWENVWNRLKLVTWKPNRKSLLSSGGP